MPSANGATRLPSSAALSAGCKVADSCRAQFTTFFQEDDDRITHRPFAYATQAITRAPRAARARSAAIPRSGGSKPNTGRKRNCLNRRNDCWPSGRNGWRHKLEVDLKDERGLFNRRMTLKPRISYQEFQNLIHKRPTIAALIDRYIAENDARIGVSQRCIYGIWKRSFVADRQAHELTKHDIVEHCRRRIRDGVKPATVKQDYTYLRVVIRDAEMVWEIPGVTLATLDKAKAILDKQGLIGGSAPRTRRPSDDEIARLYALFEQEDAHAEIKMRIVAEFQIESGRRISETCKLERRDIDLERHVYLIRDMKNPKGKGYHAEAVLFGRAEEIIRERLAVIPDHPNARLFPWNPHSCSHRYTEAKKKLGIVGLRMHDSRRHKFSGMLEQGYSVAQVQQVSRHLNSIILLKNYVTTSAEEVLRGPAALRTTQ